MDLVDPNWGGMLGVIVHYAIRLSVVALLALLAAAIAAGVWHAVSGLTGLGANRPGASTMRRPPWWLFVLLMLAAIPLLRYALLGIGYAALGMMALTGVALLGRLLVDMAQAARGKVEKATLRSGASAISDKYPSEALTEVEAQRRHPHHELIIVKVSDPRGALRASIFVYEKTDKPDEKPIAQYWLKS